VFAAADRAVALVTGGVLRGWSSVQRPVADTRLSRDHYLLGTPYILHVIRVVVPARQIGPLNEAWPPAHRFTDSLFNVTR